MALHFAPAQPARRGPQQAFEPVREMALVAVANRCGDVGDGNAAKQQLARARDSHGLQVRVRREPDVLLKSPGEIEGTEPDERSQFRERNVRIIVRVDVLARYSNGRSLAQPVRSRAPLVCVTPDQMREGINQGRFD